MNVFELVNEVLGDTYRTIPGTNAQRDALIASALASMSTTFASLKYNAGPNYAMPEVRFGYVFRYVTSHANLFADAAGNSTLQAVFQRDPLIVTCLGGGPGSDLVGVLKALEDVAPSPTRRVQFHICDRELCWADSWGEVGLKLNVPVNASFLRHDATNSATWQPSIFLRADLFTLIYFMSELWTRRAQAEPYFDYVFSNAKPGAVLFYVDNKDAEFSGWFETLAQRNGFRIVDNYDGTAWLPGDEQKSALTGWINQFGAYPKLKTEISRRIAVKP